MAYLKPYKNTKKVEYRLKDRLENTMAWCVCVCGKVHDKSEAMLPCQVNELATSQYSVDAETLDDKTVTYMLLGNDLHHWSK